MRDICAGPEILVKVLTGRQDTLTLQVQVPMEYFCSGASVSNKIGLMRQKSPKRSKIQLDISFFEVAIYFIQVYRYMYLEASQRCDGVHGREFCFCWICEIVSHQDHEIEKAQFIAAYSLLKLLLLFLFCILSLLEVLCSISRFAGFEKRGVKVLSLHFA